MHAFAFSLNTSAHDLGSYIFNAVHVRAKGDPRNVQGRKEGRPKRELHGGEEGSKDKRERRCNFLDFVINSSQ